MTRVRAAASRQPQAPPQPSRRLRPRSRRPEGWSAERAGSAARRRRRGSARRSSHDGNVLGSGRQIQHEGRAALFARRLHTDDAAVCLREAARDRQTEAAAATLAAAPLERLEDPLAVGRPRSRGRDRGCARALDLPPRSPRPRRDRSATRTSARSPAGSRAHARSARRRPGSARGPVPPARPLRDRPRRRAVRAPGRARCRRSTPRDGARPGPHRGARDRAGSRRAARGDAPRFESSPTTPRDPRNPTSAPGSRGRRLQRGSRSTASEGRG